MERKIKNSPEAKQGGIPDTVKAYFAPPLKLVGEKNEITQADLCEKIKRNLTLKKTSAKSFKGIVEILKSK